MIRLYVLVEGYTEEKFVKGVLAPHLAPSVVSIPIIVKTRRDRDGKTCRGGGHWKHWYKDLLRLSGTDQSNEIRFTTIFDLYGLPEDFPRLDECAADRDTLRRATSLERAMQEVVGDWRLIPYLQRHEFEALVLACLDQIREFLEPDDHPGITTLRAAVAAAGGPENVNDGEHTAPSKRLEDAIISYEKIVHGPLAVEAAGLSVIRQKCPRFDKWLGQLEALRGET